MSWTSKQTLPLTLLSYEALTSQRHGGDKL